MTNKRIANQHHATFESIRHIDADDNDYWLARELANVLDYSQYRHFLPVVERAREACQNSGQPVADHIEDVLTMVDIGSGAKRQVEDLRLSRYACYLIVQNGDPGKAVIANGQTYFALQTRRQELADDAKFAQLNENDKRLAIRNELAAHNKHLAAAARDAGVEIARRKQRKNCAGTRCKTKPRPTGRILMSAARYAKPFRNWVAPCRKICQSQTPASSSLRRPKRSLNQRIHGSEVMASEDARTPPVSLLTLLQRPHRCLPPAAKLMLPFNTDVLADCTEGHLHAQSKVH